MAAEGLDDRDGPGSTRLQTPLTGHGIRRAVEEVVPVYRNRTLVDKMQSGELVAEIEVNGRGCKTVASNLIPGLVPRS